jgi:eukaryotic-like serine/threonine-protein kinase
MKKLFQNSLIFNLFIMLLIVLGLVFGLLSSLKIITKHGQEAKVPNVVGKKLDKALALLSAFELQIDSVYLPEKNPLEIISQDPQPDNMVKKGRIIFLVVNKTTPPTIKMPDLVNMSFRNAVLSLQSYRLVMGDTIFRPDIAAGAILEQLFKGKPISSGADIPIGSRIDLVVGAGLSDSTFNVPDFIGKTFAETKATLDALGIMVSVVWDGSISDSNAAIIYKQFPESKNELEFVNTITPGDMIDLYIMQNPSQELLNMNMAGSRKLIDPNDTSIHITYGPSTNTLPGQEDSLTKALNKAKQKKATIIAVDSALNQDNIGVDQGATDPTKKQEENNLPTNAKAPDKKDDNKKTTTNSKDKNASTIKKEGEKPKKKKVVNTDNDDMKNEFR